MSNDMFAAFTRLSARRVLRRSILRAAALGAVAAATRAPRPAAAQTSDAGALVQRLYENVDAYRYGQAYALLGAARRGEQSSAAFAGGYPNTAFVQCEVSSTKPVGNGAVAVHVRLVSWHNDGRIMGYEGVYTVGSEAGTLAILAGDHVPTVVPEGTPPLCTVDDLMFGFGPWEGAAGSRVGSIVGRNTGGGTCVAGGSPRVTLTDTGRHTLRSTSREGSPPLGIVLAPGGSAHAPLRFADWCGPTSSASIAVELPGDPAIAIIDAGTVGISYPPCLGEGQGGLLEIKGWVADVG